MIVMRIRSDGVTSTSISTVSEDTPPPQTAYQVDGMVIYTFNVFILAIYITQDLQAQYLFLSLLRYSSVWQLLESCLALAGLLLACLFLANLIIKSMSWLGLQEVKQNYTQELPELPHSTLLATEHIFELNEIFKQGHGMGTYYFPPDLKAAGCHMIYQDDITPDHINATPTTATTLSSNNQQQAAGAATNHSTANDADQEC